MDTYQDRFHQGHFGRSGYADGPGASFDYLAGEVQEYSKGYPGPSESSAASAGVADLNGGGRSHANARRASIELLDGQKGNDDGADAQATKKRLTRIAQACENCGAKKQKCSGEQPCKPCVNQGIDCTYRVSKKRGPPKGSKRTRKGDSDDRDEVKPPKQKKIVNHSNGPADQFENAIEEPLAHMQEDGIPSNISATSDNSHERNRHDIHDSGIDSSGFDLEDPLSRYRREAASTSYRPPESSLYRPPPIKSAPTPWPSSASTSYRGPEQNGQRQRLGSPSYSPYPNTSTLPSNSALFGNAARDSAAYPDYMQHYGHSAAPSSSRMSDNPEFPGSGYPGYDRYREPPPAEAIKESPSPRSARINADLPPNEIRGRAATTSNRSDPYGPSSYEERSRTLPPAIEAITQHYRGGSSGIPSLHARRTEPEERRNTYLSETKSHRAGSGPPDAWPYTRSPLSSNPPSRPTKPEMDVMMPYGSSARDSGDNDEGFTLPPIRLPNTRVEGLSNGVHIPRALFDRLIAYYFAISHHSCPIIYKPDVDIANIQNQLPPVLLDGMCCLAARFLEYDDLATFFPHLRGVGPERIRAAREQIEQHYYDRARRQIQDDDYRSDVTTVQALLLLSKRDNGSGRMLHCWQLVGSATRMVIDLGLHRKAALMCKTNDFTYGQIETRRRVFWQSYIMDKHAAASLGRPCFLREEDIDVLLPSEVAADEFERWAGHYPFQRDGRPPPENRAISTHNAFARLSIISQSIINDVYSTRARKNHFEISPTTGEYLCYVVLRELYGQLQAWKAALPPHLQWTPGSDAPPPLPHQLLLHAFFYTCQLLVFRPIVPVSNQVSFPNAHQIPRPHDVCTQAADTIMQIMDVYEQSYGMHKVPSTTAVYYIFTAATIYVGNSSSSDTKVAGQANTNLNKCIRLLDELSDACSAASQHRQILLDITSLSSTKLRSRDDAENLLSSRVPGQAKVPTKATKGTAKSPRAPGSTASSSSQLPNVQQPAPRASSKNRSQQGQASQDRQQAPSQQQPQAQQANKTSPQDNQAQVQSVQSQQVNTQQAIQDLVQQSAQNMTSVSPNYGNPAALQQQPAGIQPSQLIGANQSISSNDLSASLARWADINRFNPEQPHGLAASGNMAVTLQPGMPSQTALNNMANKGSATPQVHRSPAEAFLPVDAAQLEVNHVPSFTAQQYATQNPFDWSMFTNASTNLASANQADLAFWREMPIGFADSSDWDVFTDSYAHQLLTHIPSLNSYGTDTNGVGNSNNSGPGL